MRRKKATETPKIVIPPIVMIAHERLNMAPYNPNEMTPHERDALRASILKNGFVENLVVQKYSKRYGLSLVLIGGHQRLNELRAIRAEEGIHDPLEVPCVVLDIDDDQAMQLNVALNKIGGSANPKKLAELFAMTAPSMNDNDVLATGYTKAEIDAYVRTTLPPPPPDDDDSIPEPPRVPVSKVGDIWQLGDHLLVCGDSFDPTVRGQGLREAYVDLVITDPPYAIYGSSTGIGADIADDRMVRPFFEQLFRVIEQSVKPFGHVYICCDWRSYPAIAESSRAARAGGDYGLWPKNVVVWDKGGGLGSMYQQSHEFIAFYAKQPTPKAMKSSTKETGHRLVPKPNILHEARPSGDERQHNAAKPVPVFSWLMQNSSDPRERVVDFFGGSGTTLIAAQKLDRRSVTFEVEPKYIDVMIERWQRLTGGKASRIKQAA